MGEERIVWNPVILVPHRADPLWLSFSMLHAVISGKPTECIKSRRWVFVWRQLVTLVNVSLCNMPRYFQEVWTLIYVWWRSQAAR